MLTWDGLVPVGLILISRVFQLFVGGGNGAIELLAIFLPVAALLVRLYLGVQSIGENDCAPLVRAGQLGLLILAMLALGVFECVLILASHAPPGNGPFDRADDLQVWYGLLAAYVTCVTVAMYPGREPVSPHCVDDLDGEEW